jgi:hypothetical protein
MRAMVPDPPSGFHFFYPSSFTVLSSPCSLCSVVPDIGGVSDKLHFQKTDDAVLATPMRVPDVAFGEMRQPSLATSVTWLWLAAPFCRRMHRLERALIKQRPTSDWSKTLIFK